MIRWRDVASKQWDTMGAAVFHGCEPARVLLRAESEVFPSVISPRSFLLGHHGVL